MNLYLDPVYPYYNLQDTNTKYSGKNLHEWWLDEMHEQIDINVPGNAIFVDALAGTIRIGQGTLNGGCCPI